MSVYQALLEAQDHLPRLHRDGTNPHFASRYVTLDKLIDDLRPVLRAHGLVLIQPLQVGDDGHPLVRTIVHHVDSKTELVSDLPLGLTAGARAQEIGSAITYARRYAILALLALSTGDDDDGHAATVQKPPSTYKADVPGGPQNGSQELVEAPRVPVPPRAPAPPPINPAVGAFIHFGKNKGKPVRDLTAAQLRWYATEWTGGATAQDEALHQALEAEMTARGLS